MVKLWKRFTLLLRLDVGCQKNCISVILGLVDELYYVGQEKQVLKIMEIFTNLGSFYKGKNKETFQVYNKTFDDASGMDKI